MEHAIATPAAQMVTILACRADEAREALTKLAKRGARYGQTISWTEEPRVEQRGTHIDPATRKYVPTMVDVIDLLITGEAPRVGDFTFEAALERTPGGIIVSTAPGFEGSVGKLGRKWDGRCDHCGSERARVHGFIVRKGRTRKVVGRSCLRDFLGFDAPANLAGRFAFLRDLSGLGEDDEWGGFRGTSLDLTGELVAAARACIKLYGWRPGSFEGQTTADQVHLLGRVIVGGQGMDDVRAQQRAIRAELTANRDRYADEAASVLDWVRTLKPGRSDYLHNLQVACAADTVKSKHSNLVISAAAAWDKQVAREAERAAEKAKAADRPASFWVGEIGKRMELAGLTFESSRVLPDNGYGESVMLKFVADAGPILCWVTAYVPHVDGKAIERGQRFAAKFTVKRHGEFREVKETRVNRMALVAEPAS